MKYRYLLKIFVILVLVFAGKNSFSYNNGKMEISSVELVNDIYAKFFIGDVNGLLELLADDFVLEVTGPPIEGMHYGKYYSASGFLEFLYIVNNCFSIDQFQVKYFVAEKYEINAILQAKHIFNSGAHSITNFNEHIVFNRKGKIKYYSIVLDTFSMVSAFNGSLNEEYKMDYNEEAIEVKDYKFSKAYTKFIGLAAYKAIKRGDSDCLARLIAKDSQFIMGNSGITPYSGNYFGKKKIKKFVKKYSKEISKMILHSVVAENNKVVINFKMKGVSSNTNKTYEGNAKFAFQLNTSGRITRCYFYYDSYSAYEAYLEN